MNFMPNDREPVYLQIIRYIKQKVVRGELNPGDTIPSRREMAQILKVNPNTVQKSYKEMEEMGIINTIKSYQSSITTDENVINKIILLPLVSGVFIRKYILPLYLLFFNKYISFF